MKQPSDPSGKRPLSFLARPDFDEKGGFIVHKKPRQPNYQSSDDLPVPSGQYLKYGQNEKRYLATGKRDSDALRATLVAAGLNNDSPGNILELGCANARVLRWFFDWARQGEAWGLDIDSEMVSWCHRNLSPPFQFAVCTTTPHIFFEDHFFGLVLCYSVFTHIDDLYLSWICELRRVIRPGGYLAITVNDSLSAELQQTRIRDPDRLSRNYNSKVFKQFVDSDADMVSIGRDMQSQIVVKRDYFIDLFSHAFDCVEIVESTMGRHQTLLVFKRR